MAQIYASIITIGDELLIGQIVDTNSAWMAQQLNQVGILVKRRLSVGDNWDEIWKALDSESRESAIILITGGLGPTADDITKPLLCQYFGGKMVVSEEKLKHLVDLFQNVFKRPLLDRNLKQAEVPDNCTVLLNRRGTAPGMWFEKEGRIYVSMPGVPFEMKGIMEEDVLPKLQHLFQLPPVLHRTLVTAGIGESFLADRIQSFESSLPPHIRLAYLPNFGMVKLRLTAAGQTSSDEIDMRFAELKNQLNDVLVTDEDLTIQEVVYRLLKERGKTMGTAESCTGGYIAHLITSMPGASALYNGTVVSYSNEVKKDVLGVREETLTETGAVSEATVTEMVVGTLKQLKTDYAVATSGIMGPDGGTVQKPVGTLCIGTGDKNRVVAKTYKLRYTRERNIEQAAILALNQLRMFILGEI